MNKYIAEFIGTFFLVLTAPAENLVAGSVVFAPADHEVPLNNHYQWWNYVKGANWRHPLGPQSDIKGKEKYPVVQIIYPDAEAYAKWAGKRYAGRFWWRQPNVQEIEHIMFSAAG
jgi:formylglycine-generating enzyme